MSLSFTWDPVKAISNFKKHRVGFPEAATVFGDPLSHTVPDTDHSLGELRYITLGWSTLGRLLLVVHVDRSNIVRIISARTTTRSERKHYENQI